MLLQNLIQYGKAVLLAGWASFLLRCACQTYDQDYTFPADLAVQYRGGKAQIEIGGPYAGIEMHASMPLLNRISFFDPRANSIDRSENYWRREMWKIQHLAVRINDGAARWLNGEVYDITQTPHAVRFTTEFDGIVFKVVYRFFDKAPAFLAEFSALNRRSENMQLQLLTSLASTLRTSHSYRTIQPTSCRFLEEHSTVSHLFAEPEVGNACLFIMNMAEQPFLWEPVFTDTADYGLKLLQLSENAGQLPGRDVPANTMFEPGFTFLYRQTLPAQSMMTVRQIIGSTAADKLDSTLIHLKYNWQEAANAYERRLFNQRMQYAPLRVGEPWMDHSLEWARTLIDVNRHYLDGQLLPMPCPAQYNFFFSHDALVTALAGVYYDPERVRDDLAFIISKVDPAGRIPHACYWKDDRYVTEYAGEDNWNNMWMIIVSASYLRHTGDHCFAERLYPFLSVCLKHILSQRGPDDLIWSARPDWWDIGHNYGPRAYMTILAIRAIRDYVYLSAVLGVNLEQLPELQNLSRRMQQQLQDKLWDHDYNYLMNHFADGSSDPHWYIGSLLAAHFGLLDSVGQAQLIVTAQNKLLDKNIGIYNAFPMDFHQWKDFLRFSGDEAGAPATYFNGGIWPQGNAWYALALMRSSAYGQAFDFMRRIMTVQGIMNGPNGQPAMYEVRMPIPDDPRRYGRVDKPQFLWAAGWYLYCLYHLLGFDEDQWNVSIDPARIDFFYGSKITADVWGTKVIIESNHGAGSSALWKGQNNIWLSTIIPHQAAVHDGPLRLYRTEVNSMPIVERCASIIRDLSYDKDERQLILDVQAFPGHQDSLVIRSEGVPIGIWINEKEIPLDCVPIRKSKGKVHLIRFSHTAANQRVKLMFSASENE